MSNYVVKQGESILDVVLNATGSYANWDTFLTENELEDWTPDLIPGRSLKVPQVLVVNDLNTKRQLEIYPACNAADTDVIQKIEDIYDVLNNNWILSTGFWDDQKVWIDSKTWID
jgi:hypothetical protein